MSFKLTAVAWNVGVDKSMDRLVLLALASKADDNGRNCFPSVDGICAMTLMNRKTVFTAIARLADRGLLSVRKRGCTNSNEYVLHIDRWTENGTTQKRDDPKTEQRLSQKRYDGSTENGTTVVPKTVHDSINTLSITQSCTQSIDSPASADLFHDTAEMVEKPKKPRAKPKTQCPFPPDEQIPDEYLAYAKEKHPSIDAPKEFRKFVNSAYANGRKYSDWKAAWRTWTANAEDWKPKTTYTPRNNAPLRFDDAYYGDGSF